MSLFDPETGKLLDRDGLKSVGLSSLKDKKVTSFINEETGEFGGIKTEHSSGRIDVNVQARAVSLDTQGGKI